MSGTVTRALDPCVSCGAEVRRGARFCPHCGERRPTRLRPGLLFALLVLLALLVGWGALLGYVP